MLLIVKLQIYHLSISICVYAHLLLRRELAPALITITLHLPTRSSKSVLNRSDFLQKHHASELLSHNCRNSNSPSRLAYQLAYFSRPPWGQCGDGVPIRPGSTLLCIWSWIALSLLTPLMWFVHSLLLHSSTLRSLPSPWSRRPPLLLQRYPLDY